MSDAITVTIDEISTTVSPGTTIYQAAAQVGVEIPVLCHDPRMRPIGVCRLCVVDVGERVLAASCVRKCQKGMAVTTSNEKVEQARKTLTALLLSEHPSPCSKEASTGDCDLEALGRRYALSDVPLNVEERKPSDDSSKVIAVDHQSCILCDRCIRACNEIQSNHVLGRMGRKQQARIAFDLNQPMGNSTCVSCGECAAVCPTGALTHKPVTLPLPAREEIQKVDSVCPYCGVGCALTYHVHENRILRAEGRESPVNHQRLCVKGRYGWDYALHEHRLTMPLVRRKEAYPKGPLSSEVRGEGKNPKGKLVDYEQVLSAFREATWEEALRLSATRLRAIKEEHGSEALAGFGSAKCSNEEAYLFQKLVRAGFGTNNVDHCTRLCHASSVAALLEGIGSGAVTDIFGNACHSDFLLLTGTNTTANHPVAATFFKEAAKAGAKMLIVDPRRPQIADFAEWYCQIQPGTDVAFYNSLMHVLIEEGLCDLSFIESRTENFESLREVVAEADPEKLQAIHGIEASRIREIARAIGMAQSMMVFWGMGISQHTHGTDNARCLIALCLLTGNVGRPGTGLHPLRGQNNVQGASDAGLIPMYYPDYQKVGDQKTRQKFESAWGASLSPNPGLTVVEIMSGALEGSIKGMYMLGENPFLSDPNVNKVRKALSHLEFLVVQDIFLTETAEYADVVLPASSFLEKTGTYTNTDRRAQIGRQAISPPGEARLDWEIICDLSTRFGYPMAYESPEEIFAEFASLTKNYATLSYEALGDTGKLWPCPDPVHTNGIEVLFSEQFPTPSGRGRFVPCRFAPARELPDEEYPFVLSTGRLLEHWHTGTMTRRSSALHALQPGPFVEMHPDDVERLEMKEGEEVTARSRRGMIQLPVRVSHSVLPGSAFIPFHFREAAANLLTIDELDPDGKIPELKFCAIQIEKVQSRSEQ